MPPKDSPGGAGFAVGSLTYQNILEMLPLEARSNLKAITVEGAYTWVARARCLADEVVLRESKCKALEVELAKMKESLKRFKAAFEDVRSSSQNTTLQPAREVSAVAKGQSGLRLLLVEDDAFQAAALGEMCKSNGYLTTVVNSGEEAIDIIRKDQGFDLVLCDVVMPGKSGVEVLSWIRSEFKDSAITVIMISSNDNVELVEQCILRGADSYMLKPATSREVSTLWQFVARRQQDLERRREQHARSWKESNLRECIQIIEDSIQERPPPVKPETNPSPELKKVSVSSDQDKQKESKSAALRDPAHLEKDLMADLKAIQEFKLQPEAPLVLASKDDGFDEDTINEVQEQLKLALQKSVDTLLDAWGTTRCRGALALALESSFRSSTRDSSSRKPAETRYGRAREAAEIDMMQRPRVCSPTKARIPGFEPQSGSSFKKKHSSAQGSGSSFDKDSPGERPRTSFQDPVSHVAVDRQSSSSVRRTLERSSSSSDDDFSYPTVRREDRVMCRVCETEVAKSALETHSSICAINYKVAHENADDDKELGKLISLVESSSQRWLSELLMAGLRRHAILCYPLERLAAIAQCSINDTTSNASPLQLVGTNSRLLKRLIDVQKGQLTQMGGMVFERLASKFKELITAKVMRTQNLIERMGDDSSWNHSDGSSSFRRHKAESTISDFVLTRKLSAGGIGQVWLAKKKQTGDYFAIKVMSKDAIRALKLSQSVNVEKEILAKHSSPFLVRGYFAFRSMHHIYFALEFLPGGDLLAMLRNCGCLPEAMAGFYLAEVMLGLEYLHKLKILHRDIKPSNVLIAASGHIKLGDFGLASSASRLKQCGTLPYVAPEMVVEATAGASLDIWAAGVLFYELVVGDTPFQGESPTEILRSITSGPIREREGISKVFTPEALELLVGLLTPDPKKRLGVPNMDEIMNHPFFADTPWATMHQQQPPFVPELSHPGDTSYFDQAGPEVDPKAPQEDLVSEGGSSDEEADFEHISHVNVDHLLELTRNAAHNSP